MRFYQLSVLVCAGLLGAELALAQGETGTRKPSALVAFESARAAVISGDLNWTARLDDRNTLRFISRYARNGDMIFENRGDEQGFTGGAGGPKYPQLYLRNRNGWWSHPETAMAATFQEPGDREPAYFIQLMKDVRHVGIAPAPWSLNDGVGFKAVWDDPVHRISRWEESRSGDVHTVRGYAETGGVFTWTINAAKGWNAERVRFEGPGGRLQEAVCDLKKFGGVWLPARTEYILDGKSVALVEIQNAALNQDSDSSEFTAHVLGMEPGTHITIINKPAEGDTLSVWNGDEIVLMKDWRDDVRSGRRTWGPSFQYFIETGMSASPYLTDEQRQMGEAQNQTIDATIQVRKHESAWQAYVRQFVERYELDEAQTRRAYDVLEQCQKRANEILKRREQEMLAIVTELSSTKTPAPRREELRARLAELRGPIDAIFTETLKPRIDTLPTREQRRRAESDSAPQKP
ncbi:MAG: hypothetical protein JNG88_12215 [Phycisphaerales bacterium]|nr:hypothetical protein [Phycisphaerales bacterium]